MLSSLKGRGVDDVAVRYSGAFKGGLFSSTVKDCHLISCWLKNRLK